MKAAERAARAELRALGVRLGSSAVGRAVVDLARRLDAQPGDRAAAMLVRELRLGMAELWRQNRDGSNDELDRFLAGVATPAFRGPGD